MSSEQLNLSQGVMQVVEKISALQKPVVIVGITGGSGSGKDYFSQQLLEKINATVLSMDSYYFGIEHIPDNNFDIPSSLDLELLKSHLITLKQNKTIQKPIYDFTIHKRVGYEDYEPSKVIIIEGLFVLNEILKGELDIKIFVQASQDIRLKRRIKRDIAERGRTKESVVQQWTETVQPMHLIHVKPQISQADFVVVNE